MPTVLSDPSPAFYVILVILVAVAVGIWFRFRDRGSLIRAGIAVGLLALLFACDWFVESPREEAVRKVQEMSAAITARNAAKFLTHVSDSFDYKNRKKSDSAEMVNLAKQHNVTTAVWEFNRDGYTQVSDTELDIVFDAKATGPGGEPFLRHFKVRFVKDPDGQWRVRTFTPYNIAQKTQGSEDPIPGI